MSPPNPTIAFSSWTDEMITLSLEDYNQGKPLPHNLLSDLNPYSYLPSNLPDGIGYYLSSKVKKDTQFGSWKAKGQPCEIFTNSVLTGWRTTFEFFESQSPNENKTDWVMHEYKITRKGAGDGSKAKDYGSLCRIMLNEERVPDKGINMIAFPKSITGGQGSKSEAQKNEEVEAVSLTTAEKRNFVSRGDFLELDDIADPQSPFLSQKNEDVEAVSLTTAEKRNSVLRGDFLELDDIADPQSPFSSSFNSSCPTLASEEWFDPDVLLQELGDKRIDRKEQFKYTISGMIIPNEVVMRPAIVGKLTTEEPVKSNCSIPASVVGGENDGLGHKCKQETEAAHTSENAATSCVYKKRKGKKGVPGQIKKLQKFFCLA